MKREGRQHGMVRTQCIVPAPFNSRPGPRYNRSDSSATAGLFTKVSRKPTNHSKFTGKCGKPKCRCCHTDPANKAKDKVKGTRKIRSAEARYDTRCVDWVVGSARPELSFSGSSATEFLYELNRDSDHLDRTLQIESCGYASWSSDCEEDEETRSDADEVDGRDVDDMSYCDAGLVLEQVEDDDEGWCLVREGASLHIKLVPSQYVVKRWTKDLNAIRNFDSTLQKDDMSMEVVAISLTTYIRDFAINKLYGCTYGGLQFLSTFLEARRPTNPYAASADQVLLTALDLFYTMMAFSFVIEDIGGGTGIVACVVSGLSFLPCLALSSVLKMKGVDKFGDCNFLRQALKDLELLTYEQSSELI
ncbi:hypothetical protein RJ640_028059 [Escallonia rubra]|uniref:Uncharacterized protein n=1 Tax=Escallonia rubra TaxID=112253 RepID=A0AA88U3I6_9ASTE|nr:hypothetical protein RJ640_028059 [Escallonia rubra]